MKTLLAIMIVLMLMVGTAAFALPVLSAPWMPGQPSPLFIVKDGAGYVPHIACTAAPCDCQSC